MSKPRASMDLPDVSRFRPREAKPADDMSQLAGLAEDAGFRIRHSSQPAASPASPPAAVPAKEPASPAPRFDARSLRRSKRTAQLNIATSDETRDRFWQIAQDLGVTTGEDALIALMDAYRTVAKS